MAVNIERDSKKAWRNILIREVQFLQSLHNSTKRDYLARMNAEKPHCCEVASQYGADYWDGDRRFGYGGYKYDGRWHSVAKALKESYSLRSGDRILDIGCGKGYLLGELEREIRNPVLHGCDISEYALGNGYNGPIVEMYYSDAAEIDCPDNYYDFAYSINVFHNLSAPDLKEAVQEIMRVSKPGTPKYICVESYRNWQELQNLQCWALTCKQFHTPDDWKWLLQEYGYDGNVEFIYFQ